MERFAVVGTFADVTRRRVAEQKLRVAEERFRLLVENASEFAIFLIDLQGRIAVWNRGAEHVLGWREEEIVGQPAEILFTADDRTAGVPHREMREALDNGRAVDERWHVRRDGTLFWASGALSPVKLDNGTVDGFVKVMRDMTDHKVGEDRLKAAMGAAEQARSEAADANQAKDEFIATVSHELRTPLNTIGLWLGMLDSDKLSARDRAAGRQMIGRAILAQQQLIDDLLDVSRIASGKLRLVAREVRLSDVIKAAAEAIAPVAGERGLQFSLDVSPDVGIVRADPERLQQVLWNLLTNAVKFTPVGGTISLNARREDKEVVIAVADTGVGIRSDFLPYIFDRFSQAQTGTTRTHTGLGLGLAIAKELVSLHGGTISADSAGEGKGSIFTIKLPTTSHLALAPEQAQRRSTDHDLSGLDVLLVEDENASRDTMSMLLQVHGARVRAVDSAEAARAAITQQLPDLIVSDIGLPGEDGYALLRSIRALAIEGCSALPALAVTAFARVEDRDRALAAGFSDYLAKPVNTEALLEAVARMARAGN